MAPCPRFLLPVSLLILFLALVAAEAEAPLSNKHTLQTEDESKGNVLESELRDGPDSDSSQNFAEEDAGSEEADEMEEEEKATENEEEEPSQKALGL